MWMATKRKRIERSSVLEMKTSPELLTSTGLLVSTKAVLMNQGRPRHSMSKTLEPTMLDMAMSDFPDSRGGARVTKSSTSNSIFYSQKIVPSLATITLATVSGILVPAANSVSPITVSGMPRVSPAQRRNKITIERSRHDSFLRLCSQFSLVLSDVAVVTLYSVRSPVPVHSFHKTENVHVRMCDSCTIIIISLCSSGNVAVTWSHRPPHVIAGQYGS